MKCPSCGFTDDRVLDSRPCRDDEAVRRRRECLKCGTRFTTYEYIERTPMMVLKRDGRTEPFDREKLLDGILLAVRKRPVTRDRIDKLIDRVEATLAEGCRTEVSSEELGDLVLAELAGLDPVAYVRFASVYRKFESAEQFASELENLRKGGSCVHPARADRDH